MTLYTIINSMSKKATAQRYPRSSLWELRQIYDSSLKTILHIDHDNRIQPVDGLNRGFNVGNTVTKYVRRSSLQVCQSETKFQSKAPFSDDSSFTIVFEEDSHRRHYSTKTPYRAPSQGHILSPPPSGFKPVGIQLLARHGSRTMTSQDFDRRTLRIWRLAKDKNMLTPFGEELMTDTEWFMAETNLIGRGELTELGRREHMDLGARLFSRLPSLFTPSNTVTVMTSGKKRAVDSAQCFLNGLTESQRDLQVSIQTPDLNLLYFHKVCPAYLTFKQGDRQVKAKLNAIKTLEQTKRYARQVLLKLYQKEFVEQLTNGAYHNASDENNDPIDVAGTQDDVEAVLWLYAMFSVAPAQNEPTLMKMLSKYFTLEESEWFAYISDAQEFYIKGPSIGGTTVTYDMAKPLLVDFFSSTAACAEQSNPTRTAHLRFAHAETVIPFASLLQIPDFSDRAADPADIYTYERNPWRGAQISSMAVNIQWEIYRHENDHRQLLVRMLYNEKEARFKNDCQPIAPSSYFYDFSELKRSYTNILLPSSADMN